MLRDSAGLVPPNTGARLGMRCTPPKVQNVPYFEMLKENNPRSGFLEPAVYERLARACASIGVWMRVLFELGYTYGWRKNELLNLTRPQFLEHARNGRSGSGCLAQCGPELFPFGMPIRMPDRSKNEIFSPCWVRNICHSLPTPSLQNHI